LGSAVLFTRHTKTEQNRKHRAPRIGPLQNVSRIYLINKFNWNKLHFPNLGWKVTSIVRTSGEIQHNYGIHMTVCSRPNTLRSSPWVQPGIHQSISVTVIPLIFFCQPLYLRELCKPCTDSRLRSKSRGDFGTPRTRLRFTDKSFAVSAPSAWNSLPIDIRDCSSEATFKKDLKTFLFHGAFNLY